MKKSLFAVLASLSLLGVTSPVHAVLYTFSTSLSGAAEEPAVPSPGTGTAVVLYDSQAHTLAVQVEFSDLVGTTTVAHIHAPTAGPGAGNVGVATYPGTFPGFPAGLTSGTYSGMWDLTEAGSYTGAFLTLNGSTPEGAEAGLLAAMLAGKAYVNVHTTFRPGGEIRGFLARVPENQVPDPSSTALLLGSALLGLLGCTRRRRGY